MMKFQTDSEARFAVPAVVYTRSGHLRPRRASALLVRARHIALLAAVARAGGLTADHPNPRLAVLLR